MSDAPTRDDIYELIFARLPEWIQPDQRRHIASEVLGEVDPFIGAPRGMGDNNPPEPMETEDDRLRRTDPTRLLAIEVEQLPRLFELQFPELPARYEEFQRMANEWRVDHTTERGGLIAIADAAENKNLSEVMKQLRDFAGNDGEVDTARRKCKLMLFDGIKKLDAWFKAMSDPIMAVHGEPANKPPPGTMQFAQNLYINDKINKEKAERDRLAREAEQEALRKAEAARVAQEQEAARISALRESGVGETAARDIAESVTDRAAEAADAAAATAALIGHAAQAPVHDMVRSTSALGVTTTAAGTWDFEITSIRELCAAVAAGDAPETFIMVDSSAVRQAIRRKQNPIRKCAGLKIDVTYAARRSGTR